LGQVFNHLHLLAAVKELDELVDHVEHAVLGLGINKQGAGCRVQGAGCRVQGAGCRVQGAGCRVQGLRLLTHDVFHYVGRGVPCDVLPKWMILPVFHHVGRGVPGAVLQTIEAVTPLAASYQGIPKLLLLLQGLGFRF
jgi:hypothetical protein